MPSILPLSDAHAMEGGRVTRKQVGRWSGRLETFPWHIGRWHRALSVRIGRGRVPQARASAQAKVACPNSRTRVRSTR